MKVSLITPIVYGKLYLGTWQKIVFMDFDNRGSDRKVVVHGLGKEDGNEALCSSAKTRIWHANKNKEYHLKHAFGIFSMDYIL
jgi:hypothetical protein